MASKSELIESLDELINAVNAYLNRPVQDDPDNPAPFTNWKVIARLEAGVNLSKTLRSATNFLQEHDFHEDD